MQPSFSNYCGMKPWGDVLNRVLDRGGGGGRVTLETESPLFSFATSDTLSYTYQ